MTGWVTASTVHRWTRSRLGPTGCASRRLTGHLAVAVSHSRRVAGGSKEPRCDGVTVAPGRHNLFGYGRTQRWLAPVWQVHRCTACPSAELLFDTSRHLPEFGLRNVPLDWADQFWAPLPLHVQSWIFVPSAEPAPSTSRHLPNARIVEFGVTVHVCAAEPLQV